MIYEKDKNIDTPVSPSSPENVGAGQVIVPGESHTSEWRTRGMIRSLLY